MKKQLTLLLCIITTAFYAQDCEPTTTGLELQQSRYKQNLLVGNNASNELYYVAEDHPSGSMNLRRYASVAYSSNIWVSGKDQSGTMQFAGAKYESDGKSDWYPGPLLEDGSQIQEGCEFWDQIFYFTKKEVLDHYLTVYPDGEFDENYDCDLIPENIRNWPGRGNPLIPNLPEGQFADFWDYDQNGIYNPCQGDMPFLLINDCEINVTLSYIVYQLPEQVAFWIRNDANRSNGLTNSAAIGLQLNAYAFNFNTKDTKNSIFWKYDLINKGTKSLEDLRLSLWADFDFGCGVNDYIGCDVPRGMVYAYNQTEADKGEGCEGSQESFTNNIPIFSYSILRGLSYINDDNKMREYGLSSVYIPTSCAVSPNPNQCEPNQDVSEYYNAMRGLYLDGSEIENPNGEVTTHMYPDTPSNPDGWSLCTANAPAINTTVIMSTGGEKATLLPGQRQQIIFGGYIAENEDYPCPDLSNLYKIKDNAHGSYINCFDDIDGPTAPNMDIKLDNSSIKITLDNSFLGSNNVDQSYSQIDNLSPPNLQIMYKFEGYKIYQVGSADFDLELLYDENYSQLVYQGDLENEAQSLYNWDASYENGILTFDETLQIVAANIGIEDPIVIDKDYLTDQPFDPSQDYHFVAIAYAYNNWEDFDKVEYTGQRRQYIEGVRNIKVATSKTISSTNEINTSLPWMVNNRINTISISEIKTDLNVDVFSNSGQLLKHMEVNNVSSFSSENLSNELTSGVYFVYISSNTGDQQTVKFVVIN